MNSDPLHRHDYKKIRGPELVTNFNLHCRVSSEKFLFNDLSLSQFCWGCFPKVTSKPILDFIKYPNLIYPTESVKSWNEGIELLVWISREKKSFYEETKPSFGLSFEEIYIYTMTDTSLNHSTLFRFFFFLSSC